MGPEAKPAPARKSYAEYLSEQIEVTLNYLVEETDRSMSYYRERLAEVDIQTIEDLDDFEDFFHATYIMKRIRIPMHPVWKSDVGPSATIVLTTKHERNVFHDSIGVHLGLHLGQVRSGLAAPSPVERCLRVLGDQGADRSALQQHQRRSLHRRVPGVVPGSRAMAGRKRSPNPAGSPRRST